MNKTIIPLLLFTIGMLSCKKPQNEIDRVEIAKQYFKSINNSNYSKISKLIADTIITIEGEHKNTYSKKEYFEVLKWDSVFKPNYKIVTITKDNDIVKAKISKMGKRIAFLHEKPFVMNQTLSFQNNKIASIKTDYLNFDYQTWDKNKSELLSWVKKHHPEQIRFITNMTVSGGVSYVKAIKLYKNRDNVL